MNNRKDSSVQSIIAYQSVTCCINSSQRNLFIKKKQSKKIHLQNPPSKVNEIVQRKGRKQM